MQNENRRMKWKYTAGMILICLIVAAFLAVFLDAARARNTDIYLGDFGTSDDGWEYEYLAEGRAEKLTPVYDEVGYVQYPVEKPQAVKITRTMTENIQDAEIELLTGLGRAIEVFLDDMLLYTDFSGGERNKEGYLLPDEKQLQSVAEQGMAYQFGKNVRLSLPTDYTGKRLVIITYFLEDMEEHIPSYPYLGSWVSRFSWRVADAVMPAATMALCAVCVVLLMLVFILELSNGRNDWRILLLVLYFIFLFVKERYDTALESVGGVGGWMGVLTTSELFMIPLCIYLATLLSGWRRGFALGGMAVWIGYEGICTWNNIRDGFYVYGDWDGRGSFALVLLFAAVFLLERIQTGKWRGDKKRSFLYVMLTVFVAAMCVVYEVNRGYTEEVADFFRIMLDFFRAGSFLTLVALAQNTCAAMAVIILVSEFLRRSAETRAMFAALEERQKATMEGYERMRKAEEAVNAARHEMKHHVTALAAFLANKETDRAGEYLGVLEKNIDQLPVFQYSRNMLVNIIAGTYLDRAKEQGIEVECAIAVPEKLGIADEDLSVFLSNMLQNAVEACERLDAGVQKRIRFKMYQKDQYLFIGCANTDCDPHRGQTPERAPKEHRRHGYGMKAMSNIAEKYGSILKVDRGGGEFSVMSNLYLGVLEG